MKNTTPAAQGSPAGRSRAQHHHWPCNTTQSSDSSAASDISSFLPTSRLQGPDPSLPSHNLRTLMAESRPSNPNQKFTRVQDLPVDAFN